MPKAKGKDAESELEDSLRTIFKKRCFLYRILDTNHLTGKRGQLTVIDSVPSDYICTIDGVTFYLECKECRNKTSFPFGNITKSQKNAYRQQLAAGGIYIFAIRHEDNWYIVHASNIMETTDRNSLPWSELEQFKVNSLEEITKYL